MELEQNKYRRMLSLIAPLAIGFSLCACGSDKVAGGGPSGTEAGNAITAQILIANAPAAHAQVKLVEQNSLDGEGYTAVTNDSGIVTIEKVAVGNYTMEAIVDDSALSLQLPVNVKDTVNDIDLGKQSLQKSVFIGGSIADFIDDSSSESFKNMNGFVKFRGLDHSAAITNGKFRVFGLPAGTINMVFIPESVTDTVKISVETDAGDSITTLKPKAPESQNETLLIDDFEDGDNINLIAPKYATSALDGMWNISTYPSLYDFKIIPELPIFVSGHPFNLGIQDSENGGKEVNFTFGFPDTTLVKQSWLCVSMAIGNLSRTYDLSSVDSIAFEAWGKGTAEIQMSDENRKPENPPPGVVTYTAGNYTITLAETKTKYKLAFSDLFPNEIDRKNVSSLAFVFHSDAEFHFDNLEFIGKNLLNIWKTKE